MVSLLITVLGFLSSCASYHVTVMDDDGNVIKEHDTKKVYVGTGGFIPDAVMDPIVMTVSLAIGVPTVESSMGVGGGLNLKGYINKMATLAPTSFVGAGSAAGQWIKFHDDKGNIVSYNGFNYSLIRNAKYEKPEKK